MRERLVTLIFALGALALFLAMFVQREGGFGARNDIPRPTSAERRGNGYHAALAWLDAEGIRSVSLRERYDSLAKRSDLPASGNLLIVTLPAARGFATEEFVPLDRWVRAGNTLLVLAALSDNPDWAFALGGLASGDLNLLTGLEFETARHRDERLASRSRPGTTRRGASEAAPAGAQAPGAPVAADDSQGVTGAFRAFLEPRRTTIVPSRPHAYFSGVRTVVALSDYPQQAWTVKVPYEGFVLALARVRDTGEGALWTRPLGHGRIIVSGFGSIFTNRALGLADNAQLLANIVGVTVGERGSVLFDDIHQGLGAAYDPDKFYRDRRLYVTIGVLVALWLAWVLGSTRLRVPVPRTSRPREEELIRAAGGFLARALPSHVAARRLVENFFRRMGAHTGERREVGAAWEALERNSRIAPADIEQLRAWYTDACSSRRVPLVRLHNLIVRLDRQMAT